MAIPEPRRRRHSCWLVLLLLFGLSCATGPGDQRDEPDLPQTVTADGVVLRLGVASPELAARCLQAATIGREVLGAEFGVALFDAEHPLVLNLYGDEAALFLWAPDSESPSWRAPSAFEDGESHLALLPRSGEVAGAATLHALWYESARQGIERYVAARSVTWPTWFREGLAECLALDCWRRDAGYPDGEPLWWTGLTAVASRAELSPLWRLVHMDAYEADDEDAFRAEAAYLCWVLRQDPATWKRFAARLGGLRRTGRSFHPTKAFQATLTESYGDLGPLHARMEESLSRTGAGWIPFLGFPEQTRDGFLLTAREGEDAVIYRRVLPGPAFDLEFECRRLDPAPGALLVFFSMDSPRPTGFLRLGIADEGVLTVDRFRGGAYDRSETATYLLDRGLFESDAWTRVMVRVTGRHLEVVVGDHLLLDEDVTVLPGGSGDYLGIGCKAGIYEVRHIVHRSRPWPE